MAYTPKTDWKNLPDVTTPVTAAELVRIEQGVADASTPAWADVTGKPATFTPVVGTTSTTAKAGNYAPTSAEVATALKAKAQIASLAAITAADATDLPTVIALANATKASVNAIVSALKA